MYDDKAEFSETISDQLEAIDINTLFMDSVLVKKEYLRESSLDR